MAKPPSTVVRMVGKTRAPTGKRLHVAMGNHHAIFMGKLTNCLWSFSIANCLFTRGYLDAWWLSIIHNITCKLRTFWDSQPYTILIISGNVAGYGHLKSPYTLEKYGEIWRCFILLFSYFQVNLIHTPGESIWLVLSPPLKNISQLRWWNVQLNGKIKVMCQSPPTRIDILHVCFVPSALGSSVVKKPTTTCSKTLPGCVQVQGKCASDTELGSPKAKRNGMRRKINQNILVVTIGW